MLGCSQTWWGSQQWMKAYLKPTLTFCFRDEVMGLVEIWQNDKSTEMWFIVLDFKVDQNDVLLFWVEFELW